MRGKTDLKRLHALPYPHGGIWFGGWATGDTGIFHYLFVRKYVASEPVAAVGAEI